MCSAWHLNSTALCEIFLVVYVPMKGGACRCLCAFKIGLPRAKEYFLCKDCVCAC